MSPSRTNSAALRRLDYKAIVEVVESLCMQAAYELPEDVTRALDEALDKETHPFGIKILEALLENARIAREDRIPICQDTGLAIVFVELGANLVIIPPPDKPEATLADAINEGVSAGYEKGFLRKSVVAEPLDHRENTSTNTPAIIHLSFVAGDQLKLTLLAKGGGCENKCQFHMFKPTAEKRAVTRWVVNAVKHAGPDACPPFVIGLGLGGDFELAAMLSKKALLRPIGSIHHEPFYAELEKEMLEKINDLGLGPQGLGGKTTALAVHIETAPCHIASLPAALTIECHAHRHKSVVL